MFVSESGAFKLGDFGIARQVEKTVAGLSKKGTFTYIAPEVYKGEAYGSTVDIYSLGIVMYRLLNNNRVPFMPSYPAVISHADRETALVRRMRGEEIEKPVNADGRLAEIVLKACAFKPEDRYNSPLLMRMELEAILYDDAEKKMIYPQGDKAEQKSVKYVKTEEDYTATLQNTQYRLENEETQLMTELPKDFAEKAEPPKSEVLKPKNKPQKSSEKIVASDVLSKDRGLNKLFIAIGAVAAVVIVIFVLASLFKGSADSDKEITTEETMAETTTEATTEATTETTTEAATEATTEAVTEAPAQVATAAQTQTGGSSSYSGGSSSCSSGSNSGYDYSSSGSSSGGSTDHSSSGSTDSSSDYSGSDSSSSSSDSGSSSSTEDSPGSAGNSSDSIEAPELFIGFD
ncbi:MAG: protein kinase [Clostridiales bacterium]|nr:protein kinase [Clostridiales bacterium]